MKKRIAILLVVLLVFSLAAKKVSLGSISGTVKDEFSKKGIANVVISITSNGKPIGDISTNRKGVFKQPKLYPGTYTVTTKAEGYLAYANEKVVVRSGKATKLKILLSKDAAQKISMDISIGAPPVFSELSDNIGLVSGSAAGSARSEMYPYSPPSPYTRPNVMMPRVPPPSGTDDFSAIKPNIFHSPLAEPLSTFSIDVDTANYTAI
ncbi:MAG: von Willebrand factor type A domain-containing protein, partial [Candidatus Cloacimonetes bacterium]|nr:von Willebrand factor type A domain-containing protein [Candidatus Cloacimonadota bacterium]